MIRLGRTAYQIADGSSVGMNDYEKYPYVMDGAFLTYNTESLAVDLWGAYLPKVWNGSVEAEQYKRAVGASLDVRSLPEEFKMANLHIIYVDKGDSDQVRVGLGIGGDISGLDYKLTGAVHGDGEEALSNLLGKYILLMDSWVILLILMLASMLVVTMNQKGMILFTTIVTLAQVCLT